MTLDTLIAVLALLIAAYQIMPRARQLDLKLRFSVIDAVVLGLTLLAILYLQFYPALKLIKRTPHFGLSDWGITPQMVSFVVLIIGAAIVFTRMHFAKLSVKQIPRLRDLTEELISQKNFLELFRLLERHLKDLTNLAKTDATAASILHAIFTSKASVNALAQSRPYLILNLLNHDLPEEKEFVQEFWKALLWDPSSKLYFELDSNDWIQRNWYLFPEGNRLLKYFFEDGHVAEEYSLWNPIGEAIINQLDRLNVDSGPDPFNLPPDRETDDNSGETPLFAGLQLFDIMVSQAIKTNVEWHMWIYYFCQIVPKILRNNEPWDDQEERTFRNSYDKALEIMFSHLRRWVELLNDVPADQANVVLDRTSGDHENENIPKSALIVLGMCLEDFLCASNIHDGLKNTVVHSIYGLYFNLLTWKRDDYATVLLNVLRPTRLHPEHCKLEYLRIIKLSFRQLDKYHYPNDHVTALEEGLDAIERHIASMR